MKELKSKKSGVTRTISDDEYNEIVKSDKDRKFKILDRFTVTDLKMRSIIPPFREVPKETKEIKISKKLKA
jgi:hypothetical protein